MIRSRELRIGNYVLVGNDYDVVIGLELHNIKTSLPGEGIGKWQHEIDVHPILLTEGWLTRLGYTWDQSGIGMGKVINDKEYIMVTIDPEVSGTRFNTVELGYYPGNIEDEQWIQLRKKFNYVHELQNLEDALT